MPDGDELRPINVSPGVMNQNEEKDNEGKSDTGT
jgi:hypothetical protein